jgi:hypothetical protein
MSTHIYEVHLYFYLVSLFLDKTQVILVSFCCPCGRGFSVTHLEAQSACSFYRSVPASLVNIPAELNSVPSSLGSGRTILWYTTIALVQR